MANPSAERIQKVPGKLCLNPTDLTKDFPHDGTGLGVVRDVEWRPEVRNFVVHAEEYGGPVEALWAGESGILAVVVREMDSDLLAAVFLDVAVGATTGRNVVQGRVGTDTKRAGSSLEALSGVIYFSPDDKKHHGIILYRALPLVPAAARINFQLGQDVGLLCHFLATPDDNADKRTRYIGPREDLVL